MMTDIEIAQKNVMIPVAEVAAKIGLDEKDLDFYGSYKAKVTFDKLNSLQSSAKKGKLILVTAMTPTAAGEGKSTVTIALGDGLNRIGKKTVIALREPSLGPCFGIKGGACGGGYAQVVPMEDINLHFTGDIHAITAANNLMAALIDNHLQQGNVLNIDPRTISWKRCVDLNDRALRNVIIGLGSRIDGVPRESHFQISVASEIMAIVCLSKNISELKERISRIIIGQTYAKENVTFGQLKCTGAVAALLKDAIRPNLVQTLEKNPAFIHGGPFANIAHGCNSINATLCALATGDYVVTEAGFAADLGAEKFFDIKCRMHGLKPNATVIVATCRAIKMHGGVLKADLGKENLEAIKAGFENVKAHINNMKKFGLPCVVAVNKFITDTDAEVSLVQQLAKECGSEAILCEGWGKGGEGAKELAEKVAALCDAPNTFKNIYELDKSFKEKIEILAKEIYGAASVEFDAKALKKLKEYEAAGYGNLPVCMAKTQNSISHDKSKLGAPSGYGFPVRDVQLYSGAGFVVAYAGDMVDMPGLPKVPAAENIDVDDNGVISGLF
ncbi:formate--tetrahydrofolate ligase [Treponema sp.]|uniref:formate--tetrahydrofolate ligase n=1 Tax=Treponema sp. TaxID=166 RepID=UPI0038901118